MFELCLRVQPDERNEDPHNRLRKKFPGARIALWCYHHTDILEIESEGLDILHEISAEGMTNDAFLLSLSSLFGNLTEKQMKALLAAIEGGYYEIPKRTTADELAGKLGTPRSTLEEHIRKAESKIVLAMAPYMMMYARVPESPFTSKTRAATDPVGTRFLKQLAVQTAAKTRNN